MRTRVFRGFLLLAVLSKCAMPAAAEQKAGIKAQGSASDTSAARSAVATVCPADDRFARAGFRAFIDPQTGQLREPTPEEARVLSRAARAEFARTVESLEAVVHPDGMTSVDLNGLFMQDLVVVKRPDGSLSMRCLPDSEKDSTPAAPAPPKPAPAFKDR